MSVGRLVSLPRSASRLPATAVGRASSLRRARRLVFESLDSRCLLSAAPLEADPAPVAEVTESCQPEAIQDAVAAAQLEQAADELLAALGPVYPADPADAPAALAAPAPLTREPLTSMEGAEGEGPTFPPPPGGGTTITALEITSFTFYETTYGKIFTGKVQITGTFDPNLRVEMGGLLAGQYAALSQNGDFSFYWSAPIGTYGDVSAQARVATVSSNVAWVHII